MPRPNAKNFWFYAGGVGAGLVILSSILLYFGYNHYPTLLPALINKVPVSLGRAKPKPTPLPFQELTIPYLKGREYVSELGELEKIDESAEYTDYLTNYDSDGLNIQGLLVVPKGEMPEGGWPGVILVHGYIPPSTYQTLVNYRSWADGLAGQSLVVFKIDLRGHGDSEGEARGGYYSGDYVIDTLNAYAALEKFELVDSQKIGLMGHSMAGNVVLRALAARPDIPKAVIWAGAVYTYEDLKEFRISDNSWRPPETTARRQRYRQELFDTYGEFDPRGEFWKLVPATNYLDEVTGAIQIHHAVDDEVVNIGYSRGLSQILDKTAVSHELYEYPAGGHNLTGESFGVALERTAGFFKE